MEGGGVVDVVGGMVGGIRNPGRYLPVGGGKHPLGGRGGNGDGDGGTTTGGATEYKESRNAKRKRREMEDSIRYTAATTTTTTATASDLGFDDDDDDEDGRRDGLPTTTATATTTSIWAVPSAEETDLSDSRLTDVDRGTLSSDQKSFLSSLALKESLRTGEGGGPTEEERHKIDDDRMVERKVSHLLPSRLEPGAEAAVPTTRFHRPGEEVDYQGRPWTSCPPGVVRSDPTEDPEDCYVPKRCEQRLKGHDKGVHCVRFVPGTGHLLLSGGMDGKVKCWKIGSSPGGKIQCMRTYDGHTAAVRDVCWSNDGKRFLTASYDRYVRLWDVETGECIKTFTNRRVPYVVKFYPLDNNYFIGGYSDNKAVAYDVRTGEIAQEYSHHLAPVNTITFVNSGSQFVTTSDDKKILVFEWNMNVPVKYIAEPDMHAVPAVATHPTKDFIACQSMDNEIKVYRSGSKFNLHKGKVFKGHQPAGYACGLTVSPDGRFIASGDSQGKVFFWDWNTGRCLRKMHAHDGGPCIDAQWHPGGGDMVATAGWDGTVKIWTNEKGKGKGKGKKK